MYPVLAPVSRCYPRYKGRLPTRYSPVRHSTRSPKTTFSFDLHVLSTPPAFVLSQDQTLQFKAGNRSEETSSPTDLMFRSTHKSINGSHYSVFKDRCKPGLFSCPAREPMLPWFPWKPQKFPRPPAQKGKLSFYCKRQNCQSLLEPRPPDLSRSRERDNL